jgi:cytochrome P450
MEVDPPVEAEHQRAQQARILKERTSRVGDEVIDNLWRRYERADREREAARRTFDAEASHFLGLDLDDFIRRIEEREQEVQSDRIVRNYPPQPHPRKGRGKGKGGGQQGKGAPRW